MKEIAKENYKEWQENQFSQIVKAFDKQMKWNEYKRIYWEIIHNIHDLLVFLILFPFIPVIYIIKCIKGIED